MKYFSASDKRVCGIFHEHGSSIFKSSRHNSLHFRIRREETYLIYCRFPDGYLRLMVTYDLLKRNNFRSLNFIFIKMQYGMLTIFLVDKISILIFPEIWILIPIIIYMHTLIYTKINIVNAIAYLWRNVFFLCQKSAWSQCWVQTVKANKIRTPFRNKGQYFGLGRYKKLKECFMTVSITMGNV